ncbi:hypothetical protein [Aneurinibacillus danicus]|uniref:Metallo-beta-lactamase domain-containing protein n=1 Tax=Aneurinibacillus danicus TaxID=267746 RepID=A0A511VBN8_9BACL|nr:hypothetical protein [Aneurinibacillus danicus]GEN35348.1 hypothetical protein ADA01nite_28080 [Aneurinibacillus danicus]
MKLTNKFIKLNDKLSIYVIGYEKKGESILVNFADKFFGVVDCYRTSQYSKTVEFIQSLGINHLDFVCWTHTDEDHTLGLSEVMENYVDYEKTMFITPEGFAPKEIFSKFEDDFDVEYKRIFELAEQNIHPANHFSANHGFSRTFYYNFAGSTTPLKLELKSYSPLSHIVKGLSLKVVESYFSEHNKIRSHPNFFSITLRLLITHPDIVPISVCLTSDLDNYVIKKMLRNEAEDCFSDNLIMKIPHHGSPNSNEIFRFINSLSHAVTTTYSSSSLPRPEIINQYKSKKSIVSNTGFKSGDFGIVHYDVFLKKHPVNLVKVTHMGAADYC